MVAGTIATMAYAKETGGVIPRHADGLEEAPDSETMIKAAGLDFEVELADLGFKPKGKQHYLRIPGRFATYRTDVEKPEAWGVSQTETFVLSQNRDVLNWSDGLLADGIMRYETAGTFKGPKDEVPGRRCWALARFPEDATIAGDTFRRYLFITWGHDGTQALTVNPTNVRVICENTYAAALGDKSQHSVVIKHTTSMRSKMEIAAETLAIVTAEQKRMAEFLERAAAKAATPDDFQQVEVALFGKPDDRGTQTKANAARFATIAAQEIAVGGQTFYSIVNTITGYADHVKAGGQKWLAADKRTADLASKRFESAVVGSAAGFKQQGTDVVLALMGK